MLKCRTVTVDGVANRFRMMIENPDHVATTQVTPFDLLGEARGFNTVARARDVLGPYLGLVAGVKRSWAEANRDLVVASYAPALRAWRPCRIQRTGRSSRRSSWLMRQHDA